MKKLLPAFAALLFCRETSAPQNTMPSAAPTHFVLKGNLKNFSHDFFALLINDYMSYEHISISLEKDGTFSKTFP
ncbi:hypothetical protein V9K67_20870 [Paraflavisolibacter sp. H34]|uniref:hypothetical protein n=1 Tax=Huijunlia imazamoxiresistens TaxID=3127457 RepID=UPI003015FAB5